MVALKLISLEEAMVVVVMVGLGAVVQLVVVMVGDVEVVEEEEMPSREKARPRRRRYSKKDK